MASLIVTLVKRYPGNTISAIESFYCCSSQQVLVLIGKLRAMNSILTAMLCSNFLCYFVSSKS